MADKSTHIKSAQEHLGHVVTQLQRLPQEGVVAELLHEAGYLARAIDAFHLEGIRFRFFALHRRLQDPSCPVDDALRERMLAVRRELELAGFQTRSITT